MTRNYIPKFIVSLIITSFIIYSLLSFIWGENGSRMQLYKMKQIRQLESSLEIQDKEIFELEQKVNTIDSPAQIESVINKVGYALDGETYYIFPREDQPNQLDFSKKSINEGIGPPRILKLGIMLGISFLSSFIIHTIIFIYRRKRRGRNE